MTEIIGFTLISIGLMFDLFGAIGLVRLPDVYLRLQAGTKCVTLGTCSLLLGTFVIMGPTAGGMKALLCIFFIALTDAVSAHVLARSAHRAKVKLCDQTVVDHYSQDKGVS